MINTRATCKPWRNSNGITEERKAMKNLSTIIHEARFQSGKPIREELLDALLVLDSLCSLATNEVFNRRYQMALKQTPKKWLGTPVRKHLWKELEDDE